LASAMTLGQAAPRLRLHGSVQGIHYVTHVKLQPFVSSVQ
jgi:hypothetical protein